MSAHCQELNCPLEQQYFRNKIEACRFSDANIHFMLSLHKEQFNTMALMVEVSLAA